MWKEFESPYVPSLEDYSGVYAKRFTSILFTKLIDHRRGWIEKHMQKFKIKDAKTAIEFGIKNIDYPFYMGQPDDLHIWNAFHGKACFKVLEDYWQTAFETMMTYVLNQRLYNKHGFGDCEDSSIFITGMLRILNIPAYEYFGAVYRDSTLLGGHAYLIAQLDDGKWHLIESTLDTPPKYPDGYPIADPDKNQWKIGSIIYKADIRLNESHYYEWVRSDMPKKYKKYAKLRKNEKEKIIKYRAIREAWGIEVKPLKKRGIIKRIRWR